MRLSQYALRVPQTKHQKGDPAPFTPIEDYAVIGDLQTVAMVGRKGSIDCLCFPEFDSPSIFAAHIDPENGSRYQIEPQWEDYREKPLYLPDTNVLITRFLSDEGVAEISNYMLLSEDGSDCDQALVRRAKCMHGRATFRLRFEPRFNYAQSGHKAEQKDAHTIVFTSKGDDGLQICLRSDQSLSLKDGDAFAEFTLKKMRRPASCSKMRA